MRHHLLSWIVSIMLSAVTMSSYAQSSGFEKLDTKEKIDPFVASLRQETEAEMRSEKRIINN